MTVTPTVQNEGATITVDGTTVVSGDPSGSITLSEGVNSIAVVVTSAGDTPVMKTYTVEVTRLPPDPDTDDDGIPDDFEALNGLDVEIDDATLDLDVDGLSNMCEYAFGSNPNDATETARPTVTCDENGYLEISFYRDIDPDDGLIYEVEVSSDLSPGSWVEDAIDVTGSDTLKTRVWRDLNDGLPAPPTRFVRVKLTSTL